MEDARVAALPERALAQLQVQPFWPGSLASFRATFAQFVSFFELEPYSVKGRRFLLGGYVNHLTEFCEQLR